MCEVLGHTRGQEVLSALGTYINKHFGSVGGFPPATAKNEFATLLPFSNPEEAGRILKDFAEDLQNEG